MAKYRKYFYQDLSSQADYNLFSSENSANIITVKPTVDIASSTDGGPSDGGSTAGSGTQNNGSGTGQDAVSGDGEQTGETTAPANGENDSSGLNAPPQDDSGSAAGELNTGGNSSDNQDQAPDADMVSTPTPGSDNGTDNESTGGDGSTTDGSASDIGGVESGNTAPAAPAGDSSGEGDSAGGASAGTDNPAPPAPPAAPASAPAGDTGQGESSLLDNFIYGMNSLFAYFGQLDIFNLKLAKAEQATSSESVDGGGAIRQSLVFQNFSVPESISNTAFGQAALRLSLAGKSEYKDDRLLFEYSLDDSWLPLGSLDINQTISNAQIGDYFELKLDNIDTWDQLNRLKVRISYVNDEFAPEEDMRPMAIYLDALWLEVNYDDQNGPDEIGSSSDEVKTDEDGEVQGAEEELAPLPEDLLDETQITKVENSDEQQFDLYLLSAKTDFESEDAPKFRFRYQRRKNLASRIIDSLLSPFLDEYRNLSVDARVAVSGADSQEIPVKADITYFDGGEFEVELTSPVRELPPGKHVLKLIISDNGQEYTATQDFTWGVLAYNSNKSIYAPGEQAYLQMAVLDDKGDTLCHPDYLRLEIKDPLGRVTYLSTYNGLLIENPECGLNNVIDEPDFYGYYDVKEPGIYNVNLVAGTVNGERQISDSFEVREEVPFAIERIGPTRIYPKALYKMTLKVTPRNDFQGQFVETIPASFAVVSGRGATTTLADSGKILSWDVDWEASSTYELTYTFDAPDKSPYFYLLGPAEVRQRPGKATSTAADKNIDKEDFFNGTGDNWQTVFSESREWQVASDATLEYYLARRDTNQTWSVDAGQTIGWLTASGTPEAGTVGSANGWIDGANFTPGERYLILAWGAHNTNNNNCRSGLRVSHGGTAFDESATIEETDRTETYRTTPWFWFTVWTAADEDLDIDFYGDNQSANNNRTILIGNITLMAVNAEELIANGDLIYDTDTGAGVLDTNWAAKANISWTPVNNNENWWLGAYSQGDIVDINSDQYEARLNIDSGTIRSFQSIEGEDTDDTPLYGLGWAQPFSDAAHSAAVEVQENVADEAYLSSGIFALNLNAFEQFNYISDTDPTTISERFINTRIVGVNPVPRSQGDWLVTGGYVAEDNGQAVIGRIKEDWTDIVDLHGGWQQNNTDFVPWTGGDISDFSTTSKDIAIYALTAGTGSANVDHPWLAAFSLELASPFYAYADEQYKSDLNTAVSNGGWTDESEINLHAIANNIATTSSQIDFYYQLLDNSGGFTTATTVPAGPCTNGETWNDRAGCNNIWTVAVTDFNRIASGTVNIPDLPEATDGYKWQVMACNDAGECTDWDSFNPVTPHFKTDLTAPTAPGDLSVIDTTANSITVKLGNAAEEDYFKTYKIFYATTSPVSESAYEYKGSELSYQDYNGASTTKLTGLAPDTEYWVNIWAYDLAGNTASATAISAATMAGNRRANTVEFQAGSYSADGTTGEDTDTDQVFAPFDFFLGENKIDIENAYLVFEAHFDAYNQTGGDYTGYQLAFDACQELCSADAFNSTSSVSEYNHTVLAYNEGGGNEVRLLLDVTGQLKLKNYSGGRLEGQVGYRLDQGAPINSISYAKAKLVVTYSYDKDSPTLTNTVIYPLESGATGDAGTRRAVQTDSCTLDSNCPLFGYNMEIPEYGVSGYADSLSQWFQLYTVNDSNAASDISMTVNIEGTDATSSAYIHEAGMANEQGNFPEVVYSDVAGYAPNTDQQLEVHNQLLAAGSGDYYLLGGEVADTYIASSAAAVKTRTVSFPMGAINDGLTDVATYGRADVYFPENGNSTGIVTVKKAWIRIVSNNYNTSPYTLTVAARVGSGATSSDYVYDYDVGRATIKPSFNIIHVLASTTYSELESANAGVPVRVSLETTNDNTVQGGLSAELMVTYTYTDEQDGYLTSLKLYAGQSDGDETDNRSRYFSTTSAPLVFPEDSHKSLLGGALLASYLISDSDNAVNTNYRMALDLESSVTDCSSQLWYGRPDGFNGFIELYWDVSPALTTVHHQTYNVCYANNGGLDPDGSGGAKMNGQLVYTYMYSNPAAIKVSADQQYKVAGSQIIPNGAWMEEDDVILEASAIDRDAGTVMNFYYQLIPTGQAFSTATTAPSNPCLAGTAFDTCNSKIWTASDIIMAGNADAQTIAMNLPEATARFKWQVKACNDNGTCSDWVPFDAAAQY